jgi:transcriptional regulator with PAS, ATPase and Fis domain
VTRLGGTRSIPVDFKLIAASNKNLKELVKNAQFREDLYYRLAVFKIRIPPLRERGLDILKLAAFFIEAAAKQMQVNVPVLSNPVKSKLLKYTWPGNVRQLENAMSYAVNMAKDDIILIQDLPDDVLEEGSVSERDADIRNAR